MNKFNYNEVVVIDLEATCWKSRTETAANTTEIIEIGVCVLDVTTGEISKKQGLIVNPRNSKVSPFCTELTSITQEMVDAGMGFYSAIDILKNEYQVGARMIAAYGNYDQKMLEIELKRYGIESPFSSTYLNISALATLKLKAGKRLGLSNTCNRLNLKFEGRAHRGVDDAVMAAKVLFEVMK